VRIIGLHPLDAAIVAAYIVLILWIGQRAARRTTDTDEFFLAGRKLGRVYQFFLNFGCSTNADQAVAVSREIYRQGIGGMWIQFLVLFLTPFYWFTVLLFRRVRLTTIGDYFTERFRSPFLGGAYAIFILLVSIIGSGVGFMVAAKTMMALTPKTIEQCTPAERQSIEEFQEYQTLREQLATGVTVEERARFDVLSEKNKHGELRSFASHVDPILFYIVFAVIVGIYTMMGGFRAAAITDSIQGVLIVLFSVLLIPAGLARIGGFAGLHATVPEYMFSLFGSASLSDYGWYTILAMIAANLVSIVAVVSGMQSAGSARDEMTARIGMIGGMYFKRVIMIFWALAGLLAIGLYAGRLHDPDLIWGYMTRDLLFPGAIGLMLVGILAANMSTLDASAVSYSALFIRNLYQPFRPGRSEAHYLTMGRLAIPVTLVGGILVAIQADNLLELYKYAITVPGIFGAAIWLGFLWRRLTRNAIILQTSICIIIYAIIPNLFNTMEWSRTHEAYLVQTRPRTVVVESKARPVDVAAGRADRVGRTITSERQMEPVAVFFDQVAREDPEDPGSRLVGLGRFNAELWVISWTGVDLRGLPKSWLVALRFFFDAIFPFLLLFLFSAFTRPVEKEHLDRFFAKMHTPVQPTEEEERAALEAARADPDQFEQKKIWPGSNWEIMKPSRMDYIGFFGSWVLVGIIILMLWGMVSIR